MVFDVPLHWIPKTFPFCTGLRLTASCAGVSVPPRSRQTTAVNACPGVFPCCPSVENKRNNLALTSGDTKRVLIVFSETAVVDETRDGAGRRPGSGVPQELLSCYLHRPRSS